MRKRNLLALGAGLALYASGAGAVTITFTSSPASIAADWGNIRSYDTGFLRVTSFGLTGSGPTFQTAALNVYSSGLGVCNRAEDNDTNCPTGDHTVDTSGPNDYVLFFFSSAVSNVSVSLTAFGDTDVRYWTGNIANLASASPSGTAIPSGYGSGVSDSGGSSNRNVSVSGTFNALLLRGGNALNTSSNDSFKISSISYDRPPDDTTVPEPATYALMGVGLLALGIFRRKR